MPDSFHCKFNQSFFQLGAKRYLGVLYRLENGHYIDLLKAEAHHKCVPKLLVQRKRPSKKLKRNLLMFVESFPRHGCGQRKLSSEKKKPSVLTFLDLHSVGVDCYSFINITVNCSVKRNPLIFYIDYFDSSSFPFIKILKRR